MNKVPVFGEWSTLAKVTLLGDPVPYTAGRGCIFAYGEEQTLVRAKSETVQTPPQEPDKPRHFLAKYFMLFQMTNAVLAKRE